MDREALGQATHLLPWVLEHSVRHPIGHTIAYVWKTFSTFCTDPLNKIPIDWTLPPFHRKAKTALRGSWMIPPWTIKSNWEVFILKPGECSSDARGLSCCPEGLNMVDIKSLMKTCLKVGNQNDIVWKWWSEFTSSSPLILCSTGWCNKQSWETLKGSSEQRDLEKVQNAHSGNRYMYCIDFME